MKNPENRVTISYVGWGRGAKDEKLKGKVTRA